MDGKKIAAGLAAALLALVFVLAPAFGDDFWRDAIRYRIPLNPGTLAVPLTPDWTVAFPSAGKLVAVNQAMDATLTVEILAADGQLQTLVSALSGNCPGMQSRILTAGDTVIEETFCASPARAGYLELGRYFMENGTLISVKAEIASSGFQIYADSIWNILRSAQIESGASPKIAVTSGRKLYRSPESGFALAYPQSWQVSTTGKNVLFFVPKGASMQVTPATDAMGGNPQQMFEDFQKTLAYSLKGYAPGASDTIRISGVDAQRFTYNYNLPDGGVMEASAILLQFPQRSFLVVCTSPAARFGSAWATFASILDSFQVTP